MTDENPGETSMARDVQITFDCADPAGLAAFWAEALGYQLQDPPEGRLRRYEPAPPLGAGHIVVADPEGNEFCLD